MKLSLERLESRDVPSTAADIASHYKPGWDPMPGMPLDKVGVVTFDPDPLDGSTPIYDLFYSMDGGSPRLRAIDGQTGAVAFDRILFDEDLRTGLTGVAAIGNDIYAAVGEGGGPVVAKINMTTFAVTNFFAKGFPTDTWRHGVKVYAMDVDNTNGQQNPPGGEELLVLPNGNFGGPVVSVFNAHTEEFRFSILIGPADFRGEMEAVPAGGNLQLPTGKMGALWQQVGKPETTVGVAWDGSFAPHDYVEKDGRIFFADPIG